MAVQLPKTLKSAEDFFFNTPLYEKVRLQEGPLDTIDPKRGLRYQVYGLGAKVDGFCPECDREVTYSVDSTVSENNLVNYELRHSHDRATLTCDRDRTHKIFFVWISKGGTLSKYGQTPSLADITLPALGGLRKSMTTVDGSEFFKAVGLAAHGVGIGSFVYLRRVFERLITTRFDEFKDSEGWEEEDYRKLRMREKIELMKSHLPDFLVENKEVYSILSVGVHSLDEQQCLGFFDLMRDSIVMILEEDLRKKEDLAKKAALKKAIKGIDLTKLALED